MLEIRRSASAGMERLTAPCAGCWLHVTQPAAADLAVVREFGVPASLLDHVSDIDERPRVEHAGECVLVDPAYAVNDLLDVAKIESAIGSVDLERSDLRPLLRRYSNSISLLCFSSSASGAPYP